MFESVIANLISAAISYVIVSAAKSLWQHISSTPENAAKPSGPYSAKTVKRQFHITMISTPLLFAFGVSSPSGSRFFWYVMAFVSLFLELGAFDAAFSFYPSDNPVIVPSNDRPDDNGNQSH